jgi:hypothetical protein
MGSSGWYYFAPYQNDLEAVLCKLQAKVFADGDYYHPLLFLRAFVQSRAFQNLSTDEQAETLVELQELEVQGLPQTVRALLEENAEEGTHSILDIAHIAEMTQFETAAPLTQEELLRLFGTTQPTRSVVEQHLEELQGLRPRWCGTYIIIYHAEQPSEVCFVGHSGD